MKILSILFLLSLHIALQGADVVAHDQSYYTKNVRNVELIYSEANIPYARQAAKIENALQPLYEKSFAYIMDEPLHVGIISEYNQIANGFSTQYPNNRQINYIGGALSSDYFCSTSWLNTLLYHESAHNYQMNAKDNIVSSSLHSIIGNGTFLLFPWFSIPNSAEGSFMAEGNAVLNESWHGNGGRLYSGRFKAATLMQAKAGYLTPERVYNDNLYFLYGSHHYTLGGFYHYYLAEHYGLDRVNHYWKEHSKDWLIPLFTNFSLQRAIGVDFDTSFKAWQEEMRQTSQHLIEAQGDIIAQSQFFYPLNDDDSEIYFIINENGRERPELIIYDKNITQAKTFAGSWIGGKVIRTDSTSYTTQASGMDTPWRIWIGLYDEGGFLQNDTRSKVIEGYLSDGRAVYFDVASSFDQPQLYVGGEFYAQIHSSVFIGSDDNLYYFVQGKHKKRTLYKNKTPLVSLEGYYSYVSGVDSKGAIYFIANSEYGSSLYRYFEGALSRASAADTIIDARLIDDKHALIASIGSDTFSYQKIRLESLDEAPYSVKLFLEEKPYYHEGDINLHDHNLPMIDTSEPYSSVSAMNYSGSNFSIGSDKDIGLIYNLSINLADPLNQNQFSLFSSRNLDAYTIAGISYTNTQYFLQYALSAYGILDHPDSNTTHSDERDFGLIATTHLPFIKTGRYSASLDGSYYQDYTAHSRTPLSLSLPLSRSEQFGYSMYVNSLYALTPYASLDRDDVTYGGTARFEHDLPWEFYVALGVQYSKSDVKLDETTYNEERGVKVAQAIPFDADPTTLVMEGLIDTLYTQSALKSHAEIRKVFNLASYFFSFPFSLQREALFVGYTHYRLEPLSAPDTYVKINEAYGGINFATLFVHQFELPITLKYVYNDNEAIANEHSFRFNIGLGF
jgi:hypothetical protein